MANGRENQGVVTPFKIVSLIATVVTILACFVGAATWISSNMANNAASTEVVRKTQLRHEVLINKNAELIGQHAQLLAIIREHSKSIDILTDFMTQGGRFTEEDGDILHNEVSDVKDRLQNYEVMKTELSWIKRAIDRMESDINKKLDTLTDKIEDVHTHTNTGEIKKLYK